MKTTFRPKFLTAAAIAAFASLTPFHEALAQTQAFSYQGNLENGASLANGLHDFQFTLKSASSGGSNVGSPTTITKTKVNVVDGVFSTVLNFGPNAFPGADRWLEIRVRASSGGNYATLSPRQRINSAPYASLAILQPSGLPGCQWRDEHQSEQERPATLHRRFRSHQSNRRI